MVIASSGVMAVAGVGAKRGMICRRKLNWESASVKRCSIRVFDSWMMVCRAWMDCCWEASWCATMAFSSTSSAEGGEAGEGGDGAVADRGLPPEEAESVGDAG